MSTERSLMILPCLFIAPAEGRGRGVFTSEPLEAQLLIEVAPVIVMSREDRLLLDQTLLHDYIFEWNPAAKECCMALGYVPVYNHSCPSNCEYEMDYPAALIRIRTTRAINAGEELFINYNGNFDDPLPVWFELK